MSNNGTIEINHSNFLSKLDIVEQMITIVNTCQFDNTTIQNKLKYMENTYSKIKNNYEMEVIDVLAEYYDISTNICAKEQVEDTYGMYITSENYTDKLEQCINFIEALFDHVKPVSHKKSKKHRRKIQKLMALINKFKRSKIFTNIKQIDYDQCRCGVKMKIFPNTSELVCPTCGETIMLYGTVFEDTQFYNQEGQRSKHGCYDPSRHCKFWVNRIQAKENTDISKNCIDQVIYCIRRDGITDCRRLLCGQLRLYLKETRNTDCNDHIPLIRKIITGVVPPQLTQEELRQLYNLFDKSVNAFELIKPPDKSNTMYYPYIIYKILDLILKDGIRKKRILECIHLQSRDTLIANDNSWENICNIVTDLEYRPTDRNDQKIDI